MQLTDIDWIRSFAVYLATYFDNTVTQFLQFTTATGAAISATLVCAITSKNLRLLRLHLALTRSQKLGSPKPMPRQPRAAGPQRADSPRAHDARRAPAPTRPWGTGQRLLDDHGRITADKQITADHDHGSRLITDHG